MESGILDSVEGIRIPLTIGIRKSSSNYKESRIHNVESKIQDCRGLIWGNLYQAVAFFVPHKKSHREPHIGAYSSELPSAGQCVVRCATSFCMISSTVQKDYLHFVLYRHARGILNTNFCAEIKTVHKACS